jgi:HEAT repeat protein
LTSGKLVELAKVLGRNDPGVQELATSPGWLIEVEQDPLAAARQLAKRVGVDDAVRADSLLSLPGDVGKKAGEALLEALRDVDPKVRCAAASALGAIRGEGPTAEAGLLERLGDDDPAVRAAAARALGGNWGVGRAAGRGLVERLGDDDPAVRTAAVRSLGKITPDPPGAVEGLLLRLDDEAALSQSSSSDPKTIALLATVSLAAIGQRTPAAVVGPLLDAFRRLEGRSEKAELRQAVCKALSQIVGDPRVEPKGGARKGERKVFEEFWQLTTRDDLESIRLLAVDAQRQRLLHRARNDQSGRSGPEVLLDLLKSEDSRMDALYRHAVMDALMEMGKGWLPTTKTGTASISPSESKVLKNLKDLSFDSNHTWLRVAAWQILLGRVPSPPE